MAVTYNWNVVSLETAPTEGDNSDVVKTVHWEVEAVDGDHTARSYGSVGLDAPSGDFTAYASITKDQAVTWAKAKLEVADIEAGLAKQIDELKAPSIETKELPW